MWALVVFESMFGNTREVALAVGEGLASSAEVEVVEVGSAPRALDDDVDLLVVGAPTHAFGLSRASTRASAAEQAPGGIVSTGDGVREWLASLGTPATPTAAVFDTRVDRPRVPGSAAAVVSRRLRRLGMEMAGTATFLVGGVEGPLRDGELERARAWGRQLADRRTTPARMS